MADPNKVITFSRSSSGPPRMPRQKSRLGKMGYVGQVIEFDPAYPDIDLVPENEVVEEEPQEVAEKELKTPVRNKSRAKTKTKEASE